MQTSDFSLFSSLNVESLWAQASDGSTVYFQKIRTNDGVMLTSQAASLLGDMMSQLHLISIKAGLLPLKFELKNVR